MPSTTSVPRTPAGCCRAILTGTFSAIGVTGLVQISVLMAVVGGQFLPPQGLPDIFDSLARLTPNGQSFRGFVDLAAAGEAST